MTKAKILALIPLIDQDVTVYQGTSLWFRGRLELFEMSEVPADLNTNELPEYGQVITIRVRVRPLMASEE